MLLIPARKNLDMREVLQHQLGPLPQALSNFDSIKRKTNKVALARNLEEKKSNSS